jgi:hypothetical protein
VHIPRPQQSKNKAVIVKASAPQLSYSQPSLGKVLDDELHRESKLARREGAFDDLDIIELEPLAVQSALREAMLPASLRDRFPSVCAVSVLPL